MHFFNSPDMIVPPCSNKLHNNSLKKNGLHVDLVKTRHTSKLPYGLNIKGD